VLLAAAVLAGGTASVVDDEASDTLATSPTVLRARMVMRLACGVLGGALAWAAVVLTTLLATEAAPAGIFTLLWCALTAATLSVAAASTRLLPNAPAGLIGSATLLFGMLLLVLTPPIPTLGRLTEFNLWDQPAERTIWTIIAAAAVTLWATRDPARRARRGAVFH
jgi:predicted transporter